VGQHHSLGVARRAAGVDKGRQIVGGGAASALLELSLVHGRRLFEESVEGVDLGRRRLSLDEDELVHIRHRGLLAQQPLQPLFALDKDHLGTTIIDHVAGLIGCEGGVDRHQDSAYP
jgi:hypothetical protein